MTDTKNDVKTTETVKVKKSKAAKAETISFRDKTGKIKPLFEKVDTLYFARTGEKFSNRSQTVIEVLEHYVSKPPVTSTNTVLPNEEKEVFADFQNTLSNEAEILGVPVTALLENLMTVTKSGTILKIETYVKETMTDNVKASEWFDKVAFSHSFIFKNTGVNEKVLRQWLKDNAGMIEGHHEAMKITDKNHNRNAAYHKKSIAIS